MTDTTKRTTWLAAALAFATALGGCQAPDEEPASSENELASSNGLQMINGLSMLNGLSGNGLSGNGLSGNGLSGNGLLMNALTTGLLPTGTFMNSAGGRSTVSYLVRCALASGKTITAKDSGGVSYSFPGQIGVAPEWQTGTCNATCQERVSACMLAHVNTSGQHISIWLDSEGAIGYGQSTDFPYQEGSFFGNIFVNPPVANFCNGKDFDSGTVPGRLGVTQTGAPYVNPFYSGATCAGNCTAASSPYSADGFSQCKAYTHVVTVWRNFDVNTQYKICNKSTGKCLEVSGSSKTNNAAVVTRTYAAAANQKWVITQVSAKKYKVINVNSGMAMDITGARTTDGTPLIQYTYSGAANQLWAFTSLSDQPGNFEISPTSHTASSIGPVGASSADGTVVQEYTYNTADYMKWTISPG
jgi:Ricin-type beta-trefoil lectin domain-like